MGEVDGAAGRVRSDGDELAGLRGRVLPTGSRVYRQRNDIAVRPPVPPPVTVMLALAEMAPAILAVMVAVPAETAVARPVELMLAIAGALDAQETIAVTSWLLDGCLPWVMMPVAVNCAVWPAARAWVAGEIWIVLTSVLLPHPASSIPRPALKTALMHQRFTHPSLRGGPLATLLSTRSENARFLSSRDGATGLPQ